MSLNDVIMSQTQTVGNMSTFFSNGVSQTQTADLGQQNSLRTGYNASVLSLEGKSMK